MTMKKATNIEVKAGEDIIALIVMAEDGTQIAALLNEDEAENTKQSIEDAIDSLV